MEKILTIVIPTYNMQDYLHRCLDSLIVSEEQLAKLEVLVVNDGSKDNSSAIAHEYQDKCPVTFRVIDKENGNYGSCVNEALKFATGKYIKLLDADDWYDTANLSTLISRLQNTDVDAAITDYSRYFGGSNIKHADNLFKKSNYIYSLEELLQENERGVKNVQMHSILYKRACFDGIDYHQTEGISYTDKEWNLMPWINVDTILYLPLNVYQYNFEREGQTCDMNVFYKKMPEQFIGISNCLSKAEKLYPNMNELHKKLLFESIGDRINELYHTVIVTMKENPQYLIDFDKILVSDYPKYALYAATQVMHPWAFKYHFIKHWRERGYAPIPLTIRVGYFFVTKSIGAFKRLQSLFGEKDVK